MNKVCKTMMYVMGGSMIAGASYYMGLPKDKKENVKNTMKSMMNKEKKCIDDLCD